MLNSKYQFGLANEHLYELSVSRRFALASGRALTLRFDLFPVLKRHLYGCRGSMPAEIGLNTNALAHRGA